MNRFVVPLFLLAAAPAFAQEDCISIEDDGRRLACFDLAFGVKMVEKPSVTDAGKWRVSKETSAMTDDTSVFLTVISDNEVRGRYDNSGPALLVLRCRENTTSALFTFNGHFMSDIQGKGKIEYRLDDHRMTSIYATVSNDNEALGLWSGGKAIPWIKKLLSKEQLIVRATPYSESSVTATFDIRGIDNVIGDLRETCNW